MPRHPAPSPNIQAMAGGVFSTVAHLIAEQQKMGEIFPFHVGDSWLEPPEGCRYPDLADVPSGLHRYGPPGGLPELLAELAARRGVPTERILVGPGATGVLSAVLGAILEPGEEVLLLAPFWPLIPGLVRTRGGRPVELPWFHQAPDGEGLQRALEAAVGPRTVAIYLNSPNNPTGRCLRREEAEAVAAVARRHGLWILADEVYEEHVWGHPHIALRDVAPERTFSVHSFSKTYAMAGTRVGYLLAPPVPGLLAQVHKVHLHSAYSAPIGPQHLALRALRTGQAWLDGARAAYQRAGEDSARRLGLPAPEGGTFLFVDVRRRLDERGMQGFLEDGIRQGLVLAPGASCGADFGGYVRLCTTAASPEATARGVERLARMIESRA